MADVTLTYNGQNILEMSASGTKTLKAAGKICKTDIEVAYVKSGGGGTVYVANSAGTLGVEFGNGVCKVYFNGFTKTASDLPLADAIGTSDSNYRSLFAMLDSTELLYPGKYVLAPAYGSDKTTQIGWVGFYSPSSRYVRSWTMDLTATLAGTFWGVVDLLNTNAEQSNPYVDPPIS